MHNHHVVEVCNPHDGHEIVEQIIGRRAPHGGEDGVIVAQHADGVSVRCRLGQHVGADHGTRAGAVIHNNRLLQRLAQRFTDNAHDGVV